MASIKEGYNYDIFISYRQKDNRGEKWVSEFVEALKTELESTFKHEVSVYFDLSPHDGLLEMHDVAASLKDKLKCLVFIPILSQTYCDRNSFAWQHELVAFNKMAKEDMFGRDIALEGGNIMSRILPVRIHELDSNDQRIFEEETCGVLRAVEFIYMEPGVNRPLRPDDDAKDNLKKTKYRNQVNKVANAVKDIISSLNKNDQSDGASFNPAFKIKPDDKTIPSTSREKSIAVLPFRNDSPDEENTYFINGILEEILTNLQSIMELRVLSRTSVEQYRNQTKPIPEVARELGVNYILEGSAQKYGNHIRLRVQLIMAEKESHLWAKSYQEELKEVKDIFFIQSQIAEAIAGELNAAITPQEKKIIEKVPTHVMEAYDAYILGRDNWRKFTPRDFEIALEYFNTAVEKDNNFALAWIGIHDVWFGFLQLGFTPPWETDPFGKYMQALARAQELDSSLAEVHYSRANMIAMVNWDWEGCEKEYEKALEIRPNYSDVYAGLANLYASLGRKDESIKYGKIALQLDPYNIFNRVLVGCNQLHNRLPENAIEILESVLKTDNNNFLCRNALPMCYHLTDRYKDSLNGWKLLVNEFYNHSALNLDTIFDDDDSPEGYSRILNRLADDIYANQETVRFDIFNIALIYACAANRGKAIEMLKKAYEEHNPNLPFLANPVFDILKNEPDYIDLRNKMNLPLKK
jgi:TolB-like protein